MAESSSSTARAGIAGSAALMGSFTLLSRILGLVRDQVIAWMLGTGLQADAYGVAIKLPNLFRRLMGEGAMSAAYVPVLSGLLQRTEQDPQRRSEVWRFVSRFSMLFTLVLVALTVLGVIFSPAVVHVVAPGFEASPGGPGADAFDVTVALNRIVFPYLLFVCLAALAMGTLNSLGSFGPPAFTPVLLNLAIIGCALSLRDALPLPVYALGVGYLLGGVLQVAWQVPWLKRRGARLRLTAPKPDRHVVDVGRRMGVGAFGAGIYQVNVLVGVMVASSLPRGSISSLYYADRVNELVLGVWAVSVATVVLPALARTIAAGREAEARSTLSRALRLVLFVSVPAAAGLIVLARPIVGTLFFRGEFDRQSLIMTSEALEGFAVGLPAIGAARVLVSAFYARGDVARAVAMAGLSLAANLAFLALLVGDLAHQGVALAGSAAAWVSWIGLTVWYLREHGGMQLDRVLACTLRSALASTGMVVALLAGREKLGMAETGWSGALHLVIAILVGVACYLVLAWVLRAPELKELARLLGRRRSA